MRDVCGCVLLVLLGVTSLTSLSQEGRGRRGVFGAVPPAPPEIVQPGDDAPAGVGSGRVVRALVQVLVRTHRATVSPHQMAGVGQVVSANPKFGALRVA